MTSYRPAAPPPEIVLVRRERWWQKHVTMPLKPLAVEVLGFHVEHADNVDGTNTWGSSGLARQLGVNKRSINRSENQLIAAGLISIVRFKKKRESDGAWRETTVLGYAESWLDVDHDDDDGTIVVEEAPVIEWESPVEVERGRATLNSDSDSNSISDSDPDSDSISDPNSSPSGQHACMHQTGSGEPVLADTDDADDKLAVGTDADTREAWERHPSSTDYLDRAEVADLLEAAGVPEAWLSRCLSHRRQASYVRQLLARYRTEGRSPRWLSAALRDEYSVASDQSDRNRTEHVERVREAGTPSMADAKRWWSQLSPDERYRYREELLCRHDGNTRTHRLIRGWSADDDVWQAISSIMPLRAVVTG